MLVRFKSQHRSIAIFFQIVQMFPAYYIFNVLLSTLLILHVIWTYYILKILCQALLSGRVSQL